MKKKFILTGLSGMLLGVAITSLPSASSHPKASKPKPLPKPRKAKGNRLSPCPAAPTSKAISARTLPRFPLLRNTFYTVDPTRDGVGQFKGGIRNSHKRFRRRAGSLQEERRGRDGRVAEPWTIPTRWSISCLTRTAPPGKQVGPRSTPIPSGPNYA
jgi:hypothetical protein